MRASPSRRATDEASAAFGVGGLAATFFPPGEPASPILLTHKLSPAPSLWRGFCLGPRAVQPTLWLGVGVAGLLRPPEEIGKPV